MASEHTDPTCTCGGPAHGLYCPRFSPAPLPPPPEVMDRGTPRYLCAVPQPYRGRPHPSMVVGGALLLVVALVVLWRASSPAASPSPPALNVGPGWVLCEGAPPRTHRPGRVDAHACRWGGHFLCASPRCGAYGWDRDARRRAWRVVGEGETVSMAPGVDFNFQAAP